MEKPPRNEFSAIGSVSNIDTNHSALCSALSSSLLPPSLCLVVLALSRTNEKICYIGLHQHWLTVLPVPGNWQNYRSD